MNRRSALAALSLLLARPALAQPGGLPFAIDGAAEYRVRSALNGRDYLLFVYLPPNADPALRYPAFWLLDGNAYFTAAVAMLRRQVELGVVAPALLVGIGYAGKPGQWSARRNYDLTPSVSTDPGMHDETGGGPLFLRVLEEELKPFVAARHNVNRARQTLYGHSLGGLFVLHTLFNRPAAFSAYASSSPSLWYNDREVLEAEGSFVARVAAGEVNATLLLSSAGDEQYRGDDRDLLEEAGRFRMVDNASELAARLGTPGPANFAVERVVFAGETHETVPFASLNRALRFALPVEGSR